MIYTSEWMLAFEFQILIALVCIPCSKLLFNIPIRTSLIAVLLFNSIPLGAPPGYKTPFFFHDLLIPILIVFLAIRFKRFDMLELTFLTLLAWPIISILLNNIILDNNGTGWITFIYRKVGLFLFFVVACTRYLKGIKVDDFLDTCVIIWGGMAFVGIMQYFGLIQVNFNTLDGEFLDKTILESVAAQRGFMGLNRGAVGIWGATMASYCVSQLMVRNVDMKMRFLLYTLVALLSYAVILFSGSRTGFFAGSVALIYLLQQSVSYRKLFRFRRVIPIFIIGIGAIVYLLLSSPILSIIGKRFDDLMMSSSLTLRREIQLETIKYVFGNIRAFFWGMGYGSLKFIETLNAVLSHPHSEYLDILWVLGVPGLLLYLFFIYSVYKNSILPGKIVDATGISIRTLIITGMVSGLAVGNVMVTSSRLATFGMTMMFVYGLAINRVPIIYSMLGKDSSVASLW